jgi:hypothetical protein
MSAEDQRGSPRRIELPNGEVLVPDYPEFCREALGGAMRRTVSPRCRRAALCLRRGPQMASRREHEARGRTSSVGSAKR